MPVSIQRRDINATIVASDRFVLMQPKKLTMDSLPMWWRPVSCESYFSENNLKKTPTQKATGPFTRPAILSPTPMDEDWQSAIAATKATAEHDAQVAQQIKHDATEAQRLQDLLIRLVWICSLTILLL